MTSIIRAEKRPFAASLAPRGQRLRSDMKVMGLPAIPRADWSRHAVCSLPKCGVGSWADKVMRAVGR